MEAVLGCRLDDPDEGSVCALVDNRIAEAEDIEFKGALYGKGDSDKVELAKDVAALANHHGGVIVLGIGADPSGVAISASGIEFRDGEADRMRQLVAERVSPMPD